MSFLGCIVTLMKTSGVDVLVITTFCGITSIVYGKAWTNALRAYRVMIAVLPQSFYLNCTNTHQVLSDYLKTAREYPTERLWVDCLVKPTLLPLMFLSGERNGDFLLQQHCLRAMLPYFVAGVTTIMPANSAGMYNRYTMGHMTLRGTTGHIYSVFVNDIVWFLK